MKCPVYCYVMSNGYWCQMAAICSCNVYCKYLTWYLIFIDTDQVLTVLRDLTFFVPFFIFSCDGSKKHFFF